jgi:hypothetical protein
VLTGRNNKEVLFSARYFLPVDTIKRETERRRGERCISRYVDVKRKIFLARADDAARVSAAQARCEEKCSKEWTHERFLLRQQ